MKKNCWMISGVMLAAGLLAQSNAPVPASGQPLILQGTNRVEAVPAKPKAPDKKKSAAKPAAKKVAEKKTSVTEKKPVDEKPIVLVPGPATLTGDNVNVRGQATFVGEIIKRMNKGDSVKVIEQVIREKPKADEPSQWAKISYPAGADVWVHSTYIDSTNKVVLPKRLNVRAGPGENYSVVGLIERGTPVKEISTKGNWIQIEAPANAYAFVAAQYLKQEGATATVPPIISIAPPVIEPPTTTTSVPEPPTVAKTTTDATNAPPIPTPPLVPDVDTKPAPPAEEPLPPRIVSHEGVVRPTVSIQAPTKFEIWDPKTRMSINYLYSTSTNLNLGWYKGLRIIVTGEEGLDERWQNTPVITVQRIQVVE